MPELGETRTLKHLLGMQMATSALKGQLAPTVSCLFRKKERKKKVNHRPGNKHIEWNGQSELISSLDGIFVCFFFGFWRAHQEHIILCEQNYKLVE